jgi:hypothetical protein
MVVNPIVYTCNAGAYDDAENASATALEAIDLNKTCDLLHPDPRMQARFVKFHPHIVLPRSLREKNRYAIWRDANIDLYSGVFERFQDFIDSGAAIGVYAHEHRSTLYEEFLAVMRLKSSDSSKPRTANQGQEYSGALLEPTFETGVMFFDTHHPLLHPIATRVWTELQRWGPRDQLALPKVLHDVNYAPFIIGGAIRADPNIHIRPHK